MIRIVLIEGPKSQRERTSGLLRFAGCSVIGSADCLRDAEEMCACLQPDVVLLDISDLDCNNIGLQSLLKPPQPIIMVLGGDSDRASIFCAIRDGAADFIIKPFDELRLFAALEKATRTLTVEDPAHGT